MTRRETTAATPNLLNDLLERLAADEPPAQRALLQSFARVLLTRAQPEYFRGRAEGELVRQILDSFDLLERTPHRGVGVRVRVNPDAPHRAVVDTVMSDRPFIVDTIREYLLSEGLEIEYLFHPVFTIERDREGRILAIRDREPGGPEVSVIHCGARDHLGPEDATRLETEIHSRLEDVRLATDDFERMCVRLEEIARSLERLAGTLPDRKDEIAEILDFLRWIEQRGFVFLGYRSYDVVTLPDGRRAVQVERDSGLGILRREKQSAYWEPTPVDELPPPLKTRLFEGPILVVTKSNSPSRVRRLDRMDYLGIKKLDARGEVVGEHRFLGLFTRQAYAEPASQIPILRKKLERLLAEDNIPPRSHDWQETVAIFHSMPKEELFLASVEELRQDVALLREVEGTDEVRVRVRADVLGRGVNVLVVLPAAQFSEEAHRRVSEELVRAFGGAVLYDHLAILEGEVSRIHYYLAAPPDRAAGVDLGELEHRIVRLVMSWKDRLSELLEERHPPEVAHELVEAYATAFPAEYTATVDPETALADIRRLEALRTTGQMQVAIRPHAEADVEASQLRIFAPHGQLILADLMPTLDNLGIRVLEADAIDVGQVTPRATLHSFVVQGPDRRPLDIEHVEPLLASALPAIRAGVAADYPLNRLIVSARLTWSEVGVLMAYGGYAFQILAVASRKALVDALTNHPRCARLLYEIFRARFDPELTGDREAALARLNEEFAESLDAVDSIADDRTLRRLHNLVLATVRTNYFQGRARERPVPLIALKFDSTAVEMMPRPRPAYDIYVYSVPVEGVHLRRGKVARGGVRWSDRPDDFRTETLGLVKTQHVKNAVIVPVGAKGAFVLRQPPADRAALPEVGVQAYRAYIRGLLDVTDNIVEDRIVHPPDTVVYDGEDPYLVVAADKGTATFSDIANAIAADYDFWPGDAFASGGSHGYDHKKLGITARGVWECVRRHFREMGMDADRDPITVVGIGDMSGDVFGNGLLRSPHLKLVAAFDHRNIFVDPDPEPEAGYRERRRLFELPASSWADYDRSLLSAGGGIYKRGAKEIELSPQARACLGIEDSVVNGETLIRAILRARVDLIWNGGIGTYVKSSWETHADVGDVSNDSLRVDAPEVRARVLGEGGNLGFTQWARVEYALRGGRCNTDAIDNAGGVNLSDHEVNLKILARPSLARGSLSLEERDALLEEVADAVTAGVLAANQDQSRALSLELLRAQRHLADFRDLMTHLQRRGALDRALEFLPDSEELKDRALAGQTLTRPELAVLLAYAKMDLKQEILASALPDDPALVTLLHAYFPAALLERVGAATLEAHPLRRQIIATVLTNRVVDLMGSTFAFRVARDGRVSPSAVVRAWFAAAEIAGLQDLAARIREMEPEVPASVEYAWWLDVEDSLERATRWIADPLSDAGRIETIVDLHRGSVAEVQERLEDVLAPSQRAALDHGMEVPSREDASRAAAAERVARLRYLDECLEIARIARELGLAPVDVARAYYGLGATIDFPWLTQQLALGTDDDPWSRRARQNLVRDLRDVRRRLLVDALAAARDGASVEESLARFHERRADEIGQIQALLAELRQAERVGLAALMVAIREVAARAAAHG